MGFIDPMAISNAAAMGVLDFNGGPMLLALTLGLLATGGIAMALSGLNVRRLTRISLPRLAHAQLVSAGVGRAR
jgi:hypothetical protein